MTHFSENILKTTADVQFIQAAWSIREAKVIGERSECFNFDFLINVFIGSTKTKLLIGN